MGHEFNEQLLRVIVLVPIKPQEYVLVFCYRNLMKHVFHIYSEVIGPFRDRTITPRSAVFLSGSCSRQSFWQCSFFFGALVSKTILALPFYTTENSGIQCAFLLLGFNRFMGVGRNLGFARLMFFESLSRLPQNTSGYFLLIVSRGIFVLWYAVALFN